MFSECEDKLALNYVRTDFSLKNLILDYFNKHNVSLDNFIKNHTYIFELTSPYNKVVVKYSDVEIRLIGLRNLITLKEYTFDELKNEAKDINIPIVETYDFASLTQCLETFENKSYNFEGYVAFDDVNRVKIKNPAYVAVHLTKRNSAELLDLSKPHIFLDIVKQNELDEFKSSFPDATELINNLYNKYNLLINKLKFVEENLKYTIDDSKEEKRRFAMQIKNLLEENKIPASFSSVFFCINDRKVKNIGEYLRKYDNQKLYKLLCEI